MLSASALMVAASLTLAQGDGMPSHYEHLKELDYFVRASRAVVAESRLRRLGRRGARRADILLW